MEIILTGILSPIGWCIAPFVIMAVVGIIASIGYFFTRK